MFIVPLSLFLLATYLRPRTQAELSYLITAIECLSGLWCLLFAPGQIQLALVGLLVIQNRDRLKSILNREQTFTGGYLDLSDASSPAIDIEAQPIAPLHLQSSRVLASPPQRLDSPRSDNCSSEVAEFTIPAIQTSHIASEKAIAIPNQAIPNQAIPNQMVQMQYRGTTYYKSISL